MIDHLRVRGQSEAQGARKVERLKVTLQRIGGCVHQRKCYIAMA